MTTRRSFIAGLLATAAAPAVAPVLPNPYNSTYYLGLIKGFRQTKEILAANVMVEEGGWFLNSRDELIAWSRPLDPTEWLVSEGT